MRNSKILISEALNVLDGNMKRTGDPVGLKRDYWTQWARGLDLPPQGETLLLTARMYQMLPYVVQATELSAQAKPLLPLLGNRLVAKLALAANALVTPFILRRRAKHSQEIADRGRTALRGIAAALAKAGVRPAYLYGKEPYSGALLHDLGLEASVGPIARSVSQTLKASGAKTILTVDPHTTAMLKDIYPHHVEGFDLTVRHYLEVLADADLDLSGARPAGLPEKVVLHDSCVMTRDLGMVEPARRVLARLEIEVAEPENSGVNTACCGGPVEYAFETISRSISRIRTDELARSGPDVVVFCPICLINLMKHEQDLGIRVWDMGELLHLAFNRPSADQETPSK